MDMKKTLHTIYAGLVAASIALLSGCVEEDWDKGGTVIEGKPITASIKLGETTASDIVVNTRSNDDISDLNNITIFVYHGDGNFEQVVSSSDDSCEMKESTETQGVTQVSFETTSGEKKLLAVGNGEDNGFWENLENLKGEAEKLSFEELKKKLISLSKSKIGQDRITPFQITSSSQMLISGWNEGIVFDSNGDIIDYGTDGEGSKEIAVKMDRAMARITFKIEEKPERAKGTFIPGSYRVYHIPTKSNLTNKDAAPIGIESEDFINFDQTVIQTASEGNYTFSFYMPENIYNEAEEVESYNERDQWTGENGAGPEKKDWVKAPQTSTFVVISGTYEENNDNENKHYTGNVEYTIHLGDFSTPKSMGNFSVERNCSYTYKMKVLGVDNIVVEAQKEGDNDDYQQGAEGDIYDSGTSKYNYQLDAHYEQVLLEYDLSAIAKSIATGLSDEDLDDAIADKLILVIQSEAMDYIHDEDLYTVANKRGRLKPYKIYADAVRANEDVQAAKDGVLAGEGKDAKPTKGFDYKWVEFWPQEDGDKLASYPGVPAWSRDDLTDMNNKEYYGGNVNKESTKLKDVYDVIVAMGNVIKQIYNGDPVEVNGLNADGIIVSQDGQKNYKARFTAFVNEFYYLRHPLTGAKTGLWSVFTNKIPREMIIAMSTDTSADGNNTYSYIHSNISQVSMQTFYNSRVKNLNGFGIETYNETPLAYSFGSPSSSSDLTEDNGRENQLILIGAKNSTPSWSEFINSENNGWQKSVSSEHKKHKLYETYSIEAAYSACMSRNRDLNGNGRIDRNEVRWFLASLNEYIRIGIGSRAISSAAQLFIGDKQKMEKGRYPSEYIPDGSLYYTSSGENQRVYWAVEKGSYGPENDTELPIRCIRALPGTESGHDISTIEEIQSDATFEKLIDDRSNLTVLKFKDRLTTNLYRSRVAGRLDKHDEDDAANSFYDGIMVADENLERKSKLSYIIGYNNINVGNPCSSYRGGGYRDWRVPNLVELSAMEAAGLLTKGSESACCTSFSNQNVRYGFSYASWIYCPGNDQNDINLDCTIRCVRDVDENYFD